MSTFGERINNSKTLAAIAWIAAALVGLKVLFSSQSTYERVFASAATVAFVMLGTFLFRDKKSAPAQIRFWLWLAVLCFAAFDLLRSLRL